jgi:hypothetical protein
MADDDTVQAQIVPVDLYSIIHNAKEAQFAQYGKHCQWHYDEKMEALRQGKPQERLQGDRLAREVVRILLATGKSTHITGREGQGVWGNGIQFPNYSQDQVSGMLHALMNEDGLLDFIFQCHAPNYYGFESEFVIELAGRGMMSSRYNPNTELRNALIKMLVPFKAEKPQYVMPQGR